MQSKQKKGNNKVRMKTNKFENKNNRKNEMKC